LPDKSRPFPNLEIDYSEVDGRTYNCIGDCALCCLCQPELLPHEEEKFRKDPRLAAGIARRHISPDVRGAAIKLKGAHGACHFLTGKRCEIYPDRTHFCRSFPINVFVGWRIQLNVNMSCRGIGLPGENLRDSGNLVLEEYGSNMLASELRASNQVFTEFVRNTRDAWISQSFSSIRGAAGALIGELSEELGISRLLSFAEHGSLRQNASADQIARMVRKTEPEANVQERALIDGTELFDLPDLTLLPIYIDEGLRWKIFKLVDKQIVGYELSEDGATRELSRTDPSTVDLLPITSEGKKRFQEYVGLVNSRDCFLGHAAYLCDSEGYEYNFAQVYMGALANNALDLWWRASFLAAISGKEQLGPDEIREGIVFFDMDLLDLPTIGAFI
jgi:Fe-S-cluster containining protein